MNYLAHARLSFNIPDIVAGNMMSDFIKGNKRYSFTEGVQKGIMLHRQIDAFTDAHEIIKQAKVFFKPSVKLYAGAFVDVAFDHFLAIDINEFNDESLLLFSTQTYTILDIYNFVFPEKFATLFFYMKKDNWLYNYKSIEGIKKSFAGLAHRAKYLSVNNDAFNAFTANYNALENLYQLFFPQLKKFALDYLQ